MTYTNAVGRYVEEKETPLELRLGGSTPTRQELNNGLGWELLIKYKITAHQPYFKLIADAYTPYMVNYAYTILRSWEDATDAANRALYNISKGVIRHTNGSFTAYISQIVKNAAIDMIRRGKNHHSVLSGALYITENTHLDGGKLSHNSLQIPDFNTPHTELEKRESRKTLNEIISDGISNIRNSKHQEALVLKYIKGLTYLQIAEHLGIPKGTVKSRIHNGKKELRIYLQENYGEMLSKVLG